MNLIEARKQAHEGWVRSETQTEGMWVQYLGQGYRVEDDPEIYPRYCVAEDLDAEDWEPKPKPVEPWEGLVWVSPDGTWVGTELPQVWTGDNTCSWRSIRVREVVE
jgi:hypothetical protein